MKPIKYDFNPEKAFTCIKDHWILFAERNNVNKWIIGISGGKDSTVVAGLAVKIFGKDSVIGVMMPCGEQKDISDSKAVIDFLGINGVEVNIGRAFEEMLDEVTFGALKTIGIERASKDTIINMPARLRVNYPTLKGWACKGNRASLG